LNNTVLENTDKVSGLFYYMKEHDNVWRNHSCGRGNLLLGQKSRVIVARWIHLAELDPVVQH
jgi:hypothetical protein